MKIICKSNRIKLWGQLQNLSTYGLGLELPMGVADNVGELLHDRVVPDQRNDAVRYAGV